MAAAATGGGASKTNKRKRVRRRRQQDSSESDSSSSSEESSSEDEAEDDAEINDVATKKGAEVGSSSKASSSSSSSSSSPSSSSSSSSDSDSDSDSDLDLDPSTRRRRARERKKQAKQASNSQTTTTTATSTSASAAAVASRPRPYPSRSPSPDPLNVPLGMSLFPAIKPLPQGDDLLKAFIWGDVQEQEAKREKERKEMEEQFDERQETFGAYWRDQFVKEFGSELGTLAEEPGLTQPRLKLLLDSINSLSALHTTSSEAAKNSRSIWYHDPEETVDPLVGLPKASKAEVDEEWAKEKVGGLGDVESGLEGLEELKEKGIVEGKKDEAMEVDQE